MANQFMHRLALERPPLPVLSLCQDITLATALGRDGQGRQFFARQLRVVAAAEDVVLALADFHRDEAIEEGLTAGRQAGSMTAALRPGAEEPIGEAPISFPPGHRFAAAGDRGCTLLRPSAVRTDRRRTLRHLNFEPMAGFPMFFICRRACAWSSAAVRSACARPARCTGPAPGCA